MQHVHQPHVVHSQLREQPQPYECVFTLLNGNRWNVDPAVRKRRMENGRSRNVLVTGLSAHRHNNESFEGVERIQSST